MDHVKLENDFRRMLQQYGKDTARREKEILTAFEQTEGTDSEELRLLESGFRFSNGELYKYIQALRKDDQIREKHTDAQKALAQAFFDLTSIQVLLQALTEAFDYDYMDVTRGQGVFQPDIHVTELTNSFSVLRKKYGEAVWSEGKALAAYLSDISPTLITERSLTRRIMDAAQGEIQSLTALCASGKNPAKGIRTLENALGKAFIDPKYVKDTLTAILGAYNIKYEPPSPKTVRTVSGNVSQQTTGKAGSQISTAGGTASPKTFVLIGIVSVLFVIIIAGVKLSGKKKSPAAETADKEIAEEKTEMSVLESDQNEENLTDNVQTEIVPQETVKTEDTPPAGVPLEGSLEDVEPVAKTVYSENVTDLGQYRYMTLSYAKDFKIAYPVSLYENLDLSEYDEYADDRKIVFSSSDGSSLEYDFYSWVLSGRKPLPQVREALISKCSESIMDVNVLVNSDDVSESRLYLTGRVAADNSLIVHYSAVIYDGQYHSMYLCYPEGENEEDTKIKEYYAECLDRLCGYVTNKEVRTFDEFSM